MLKIYNTATRKKEIFRPIEPEKIKMYVCGPTVYDACHIGHARSVIVFDVIVRYLRATGYDVTCVRNFTDIDDKIINRANELGVSTTELSEAYIQKFHEDMDALLAGLSQGINRRRRVYWIAGASVLLVAILSLGYLLGTDRPCRGAEHRLEGIWDPGRQAEILHAAACYAAEHDLMWEIWELAGGIGNREAYRAMADPDVRRAMVDVIRQARDQDAQAAEHIERALT